MQRILRHIDVRLAESTDGHLSVDDLRDAMDKLTSSNRPLRSCYSL